jgi:hypothetical protein
MKNETADSKDKPADNPQPNAWFVRPGAQVNPFSVTLSTIPATVSGVPEGDEWRDALDDADPQHSARSSPH